MSASTAELTLIIKAQNLAKTELEKVQSGLKGISSTAKTVAGDVARSFVGLAGVLSRQVTNVLGDIFSGDKHHRLVADALALGVTLAGGLAEGLAITLVPLLMERVFASAAFAPVAAALEGGGLTLGAIFSTAIAVGAAAFPFVLLGIAVAALVYLITNPEARQKAHDVAMMILGKIGDGLMALGKLMYDLFLAGLGKAGDAVRDGAVAVVNFILDIPNQAAKLPGLMADLFSKALGEVLKTVTGIVGQIVDIILGIPKAVADALASLDLLQSRQRPGANGPAGHNLGGHAAGGWVGLNGPELSWVGEKGPEYIVPNHQLGNMAPTVKGVTIVGVSERDIMDMVDRGLYFRLQRAAPTVARS